jgi:hypothetical protein
MTLFILESPETPWGDYGSILLHGMSSRDTRSGNLVIERTGPFIPPITMPGLSDIVITASARAALESGHFSGAVFKPIIKKRIVHLDWHLWDKTSPDPRKYPAGGEPENYILGRRHSAEAAEALGELWEFHIPETPGLQLAGGAVSASLYSGEDICRGSQWGYVYVSVRFKEWLENHFPADVRFVPAVLIPGAA